MHSTSAQGLRWTALAALVALVACAPREQLAPPSAVVAVEPSSAAPSSPPEPRASVPERPTRLVLPCEDDDLVGCTNGCNDGRTEDCVTLATMLLDGTIVSIDPRRAIRLYREACGNGSSRGCLRLGDAYRKEPLRDDIEAAKLYRMACDGGNNLGCVRAGVAYLEGRGVGPDPVYAATLFGRVCERGNAAACFELARLYERGHGVQKDGSRAFELFSKACKLGHDEGCLYASRTEQVLPPRSLAE